MTNKFIYKELNITLAKVLKEQGLEGLRTAYKEVESIYAATLQEHKLDHTISIYKGPSCFKNIAASEKNVKKMRNEKNQFLIFADRKADEYYVRGRKLELRKKAYDLLFCFIKDPRPEPKIMKSLYIDVWRAEDGKIPEGKEIDKDFHVLLTDLRKHLREVAGEEGKNAIKCWSPSPTYKESRWSINPEASYCVIYE